MNIKNLKKNTAIKFLQKNVILGKNKKYTSEGKIKKVGIIVEEDLLKTYDFRKKLSESFGISMNDFKILLFQKNSKSEVLTDFETFSNKDFGMFGKIKTEIIKNFVKSDFDLFINYCPQDNIMAQVVSFQSQAVLKAGFSLEKLNFYDISIKIEANKIDTFNTELIKYLEILKLIN